MEEFMECAVHKHVYKKRKREVGMPGEEEI